MVFWFVLGGLIFGAGTYVAGRAHAESQALQEKKDAQEDADKAAEALNRESQGGNAKWLNRIHLVSDDGTRESITSYLSGWRYIHENGHSGLQPSAVWDALGEFKTAKRLYLEYMDLD